jgi:hypothetical protein
MATSLTEPLNDPAGKLCYKNEQGPPWTNACTGVYADGMEFIPNIHHGIQPSQTYAFIEDISVGVQDVSIEAWVICYGEMASGVGAARSSFGIELSPFVGGVSPIARTGANAHLLSFNRRNSPPTVTFSVGAVGSPAGTTISADYGWHHYCLNVDRSGFARLYEDSVEIAGAATDISALAAVDFGATQVFHGMSADPSAANHYNGGAVGPCAAHVNTLLTVADMKDSIDRKSVQLTANTQAAYDWRQLRGATGWEFYTNLISDPTDADCTHISKYMTATQGPTTLTGPMHALKPGLIGCPIGPAGGVMVLDISGNGRHMIVPTAVRYGVTTPPFAGAYPVACEQANTAFGHASEFS